MTTTRRRHLTARPIEQFATSHDGITTTRVLRAQGYTHDMIRSMTRRGELVRLYRGVYCVGHRALTERARWRAAVYAAGDGATLGYTAAARYWGIDRSQSTLVEVLVPRRRRPRRGFIPVIDLDIGEDRHIDDTGLSVTTPPRTIWDLAGRYPAARLAKVIREAQHLRLVTLEELERFAERAPGSVRAARLDRAIAIRRRGGDGSESNLEDEVLAYLDRLPLDQPISNHRVTIGGKRRRIDLDWPDLGVCGEVDGEFTHGTAEQRAYDLRRERELLRIRREVHRIEEVAFRADPDAAMLPLVHAVMLAMLERAAA